MDPPPLHNVPSLKDLATKVTLKLVWNNNTDAIDNLTEFAKEYVRIDYDVNYLAQKLTLYHVAIQEDTQKIMDIPHVSYCIKEYLADCLYIWAESVIHFTQNMVTDMDEVTDENIRSCIRHFEVHHDGYMDKQETFINFLFKLKLSFHRYFYLQNAIPRYKIDRIIENNSVVMDGDVLRAVNKSLPIDPKLYWQAIKSAASKGSSEALDTIDRCIESVVLYSVNPLKKGKDNQILLARCAKELLSSGIINARELIFFYQHIYHEIWLEMLKKYYICIFSKLISNTWYRHMCITFYKQSRNYVNLRLVLYMIVKHRSIITKVPEITYLSQSFNSMESLFFAFLKNSPHSEREKGLCRYSLNIIDEFLLTNNVIMIAYFIDMAFTKRFQYYLIHYTIMRMIIDQKSCLISIFIIQFQDKQCNIPTIKKIIHDIKFLREFFILDRCHHIDKYDYLLTTLKYYDIKIIKLQIPVDKNYVTAMTVAIKNRFLSAEWTFSQLLKWCFSDESSMRLYVQNFLLPQGLLEEIYKSYMLGTGNNFASLNIFNLSEEQVEYVARAISRDTEMLFKYCSDLIYSFKFSHLPQMLNAIFENDLKREEFLVKFFRSPRGERVIKFFLQDSKYEHVNFLSFCKYFLISTSVVALVRSLIEKTSPPKIGSSHMQCLYESEEHELTQKMLKVRRRHINLILKVIYRDFTDYNMLQDITKRIIGMSMGN